MVKSRLFSDWFFSIDLLVNAFTCYETYIVDAFSVHSWLASWQIVFCWVDMEETNAELPSSPVSCQHLVSKDSQRLLGTVITWQPSLSLVPCLYVSRVMYLFRWNYRKPVHFPMEIWTKSMGAVIILMSTQGEVIISMSSEGPINIPCNCHVKMSSLSWLLTPQMACWFHREIQRAFSGIHFIYTFDFIGEVKEKGKCRYSQTCF